MPIRSNRGIAPTLVCLFATVALARTTAFAADDIHPLTEREKTVHLLNRLGFGARPDDVERVERLGIIPYIEQQLHPESIDDQATDKALASLDTLKMSSAHLTEEFWGDVTRFLQMQMAAGNEEEMKLRFGIDPKRYGATTTTKPAKAPAKPGLQDLAERDALRCIGELQQAKLVRAVVSERQLNEVLADFWGNHFNIDVRKNLCRALKTADDREAIRPHVLGRFRDLLEASAKSPAMLSYLDNTENSVSRKRSYLEQKGVEWYIQSKTGMNAKGMIPDTEGPNENYGREILELHTLGVDGGYTQTDVQEVARCFTGWAINPLNGSFTFNSNRHDPGEKTVLGHVIPAGGGMKDGQLVLDILAKHPSTAKFISRKLCQRFVMDDPPAELVERIAKVFQHTDGDLRKVVEAIVTSDAFFSRAAYRSKIKSPFEFAVSAVRATNGQFVEPLVPLWAKVRFVREGSAVLGYGAEGLSGAKRKTLNWSVYDMGQPLFAFAAPTGYSEVSTKWVSPGALIDRLNFALALSAQDVSDVRIAPEKLVVGVDADQPNAVLDRLAQSLLHCDLSPGTQQTLSKNALPQGEAKTVDVAKLTALVLGSPEFQRR